MIAAVALPVLVALALLAVGMVARADPEGRGARVAAWCVVGAVICIAAVAWLAFRGS